MNFYTSPYNTQELARANAALSFEMNHDSYRFLRKRMNGLTRTDHKFSKNLWEGPEGKMEHIKTNFPMPRRVDTEQENPTPSGSRSSLNPSGGNLSSNTPGGNSSSNTSGGPSSSIPSGTGGQSSSVPSSTEEPQQNNSNSTPSLETHTNKEIYEISSSDDLSEGELPPTSHRTSLSQSSQSKNKERKSASNSDSTSNSGNSDPETSALKSYLDNSDTSTGFSSHSHSISKSTSDSQCNPLLEGLSCVSEIEQQHWVRLSKLQRKIYVARPDLTMVKTDFKKSKQEKACSQMETMHWKIHGFISELTSERELREKYNLSLISAKRLKKRKRLMSSENTQQSYFETWRSLKDLCNKFVRIWQAHKSVLSDFTALSDNPKSKMESRLKKIAITRSSNKISS